MPQDTIKKDLDELVAAQVKRLAKARKVQEAISEAKPKKEAPRPGM